MLRSGYWRNFDFWLLGAVILANAFGIAMIRSAIAGNEVLAGLDQRQIVYTGIGLAVILVTAAIDYHVWFSINRTIYILITVFLITLFFIGGVRFGAARWIETGLVSIQPTELAKIIVILALASFHQHNIDAPRDLWWVLRSLLVPAWIALWIFLQPNLSNVIVIMVIWAAMAWLNGLQFRHLLIFGAVGIAGGLVAMLAPFSPLQDYQRQRVFNFLFPNPNASYGATYNVQQALISIGAGGLFGEGYGLGSQVHLRFLKVRHTDFIFSVVAEEFGLIGTALVLILVMFIILRCLRAARLAKDQYGSMVSYGVAIVIFFQAAVNIAVNMNLIPVTGLPLPFISYGGSGLVSLMAAIGLVESVVLHHKTLEF
jgi:rod shape determining protein RodA